MNTDLKRWSNIFRLIDSITNHESIPCYECGGEGSVEYGRGEDTETLPCQVCYPPDHKFGTTTWEDLRDDEDKAE